MRKHLSAILLPILVAAFAFIAFKATATSSSFKKENTSCQSNSKEKCLLEKRRKRFSQQWQMGTWSKNNFFIF